jgi:hypothetical protein
MYLDSGSSQNIRCYLHFFVNVIGMTNALENGQLATLVEMVMIVPSI